MRLTFTDVLRALPADATLRRFFERHAVTLPQNLDWNDAPEVVAALRRAVAECPQTALRAHLKACLRQCGRLARPRGKKAVSRVLLYRSDVLPEMKLCQNALHRAFWLMVWHPLLFEEALALEYDARRAPPAQLHEWSPGAMSRDAASLDAFRCAVETFYQGELRAEEVCVVRVADADQGAVRVRVFSLPAILAGKELACPNCRMVLDYTPATGMLRTVVRAGARYHAPLAQAFARHLLGREEYKTPARPPTLNLAALADPVPATNSDLAMLRVQSITLLSPDTALKAEFSLMDEHGAASVTELVPGKLPHDNPLGGTWLVVAARLNLYFASHADKHQAKMVAFDITRRGRLKLRRFDEPLRARIERCLVRMGILLRKQPLLAQVSSPINATISGFDEGAA